MAILKRDPFMLTAEQAASIDRPEDYLGAVEEFRAEDVTIPWTTPLRARSGMDSLAASRIATWLRFKGAASGFSIGLSCRMQSLAGELARALAKQSRGERRR